jgi:hypothetical protein
MCNMFEQIGVVAQGRRVEGVLTLLQELVNTGICTGAYVIAFIVQLSIWPTSRYHYHRGANIAAGV